MNMDVTGLAVQHPNVDIDTKTLLSYPN